MDLYYGQYTLLMDNILSCPILSYILIYFCRLLYTLLYIYSYILQRGNIFLPPFLHSPSYILSILLYTMKGIISAPYFTHHIPLLMPILYTLIYYTIFSPAIFTHIPLIYCNLYCPSSYILLYPLSYIEKV